MSSTKRVSFIELEIKKCQLSYGSAPCSAAVGVTGERKCFNSRATCQDLPNIDLDDELIRFSKPSSNIRFDLEATPNSYLPNIQSISYTPSSVDLGRSLGERGTLTISFKDHRSPDTDASGDNYRSDRDYTPYNQGTYWGKFRARHPFIRGQSIWWVQGTSEQLVSNMERQQFVVESTAGPSSSGVYTIVAKDMLKLTQGDRSMAPVISQGALQSSITSSSTSAVLTPGGIGATYPSSGKIAIGGVEVVSFTRSGDNLTIVRGQDSTDAVEHDADSQMQNCLIYSAEKASDIFNDLLTTYTPIDSAYIPLTDWENESDTQLNRVYSAVIGQPTPVTQLINELLEQTGSSMYWDGLSSLVRWYVLKKPDADALEYNESNIRMNSFNIQDQLAKRISQSWVYYGQINPLLELSDKRNYSSSYVQIDEQSQDAFDGVPSIYEVFSRWILGDNRDTAERLSELMLSRYSTPPRKLGFKILRDSLPSLPALAGSYQFMSRFIQDDTGAQLSIPIQVTSVNAGESDIVVRAEEVTFNEIGAQDPDNVNLYPSNGTLNYNIYSAYVSQTGQAPTASTIVNVYVEQGFVIGSNSINSYSLTDGSGWPVGATVNLFNSGSIVGRGGNGGSGGGAEYINKYDGSIVKSEKITANPASGQVGGDAIEVLFGINITNDGLIGGGGGGGAGGESSFGYNVQASSGDILIYIGVVAGNGGGGGAGYPAGSGGDSGFRLLDVEDYPDTFLPQTKFITPLSSVGASGGLAGSLEDGAAERALTRDISAGAGISAVVESEPPGSGGGDLGIDGGNSQLANASFIGGAGGIQEQSSSSVGGTAGSAIVQNGGTVNFITTGDVRGVII